MIKYKFYDKIICFEPKTYYYYDYQTPKSFK